MVIALAIVTLSFTAPVVNGWPVHDYVVAAQGPWVTWWYPVTTPAAPGHPDSVQIDWPTDGYPRFVFIAPRNARGDTGLWSNGLLIQGGLPPDTNVAYCRHWTDNGQSPTCEWTRSTRQGVIWWDVIPSGRDAPLPPVTPEEQAQWLPLAVMSQPEVQMRLGCYDGHFTRGGVEVVCP